MTPQEDAPYLDYHVRWRAGAARPGRHAARHAGSGGDFRAYRPFWQLPDAHRIDIRRSITDPFGQVMVRQTEQRSSINVVLAADVSRSMRPSADRSSLGAVARLADAAARSALRAGDGFGVLAFDRAVRDDASLAPTASRSAAREAVVRLRRLLPMGRGAEGIAQLAARLPARRCLVLLASDFLMPIGLLEAALVSLAKHDVAPVVLDGDLTRALPRRGLLRLRDAETGRTRLMLMRPSLHRHWCEAESARRRTLDLLFRRHGRAAFHAGHALDISALSEHLAGG